MRQWGVRRRLRRTRHTVDTRSAHPTRRSRVCVCGLPPREVDACSIALPTSGCSSCCPRGVSSARPARDPQDQHRRQNQLQQALIIIYIRAASVHGRGGFSKDPQDGACLSPPQESERFVDRQSRHQHRRQHRSQNDRFSSASEPFAHMIGRVVERSRRWRLFDPKHRHTFVQDKLLQFSGLAGRKSLGTVRGPEPRLLASGHRCARSQGHKDGGLPEAIAIRARLQWRGR